MKAPGYSEQNLQQINDMRFSIDG